MVVKAPYARATNMHTGTGRERWIERSAEMSCVAAETSSYSYNSDARGCRLRLCEKGEGSEVKGHGKVVCLKRQDGRGGGRELPRHWAVVPE